MSATAHTGIHDRCDRLGVPRCECGVVGLGSMCVCTRRGISPPPHSSHNLSFRPCPVCAVFVRTRVCQSIPQRVSVSPGLAQFPSVGTKPTLSVQSRAAQEHRTHTHTHWAARATRLGQRARETGKLARAQVVELCLSISETV